MNNNVHERTILEHDADIGAVLVRLEGLEQFDRLVAYMRDGDYLEALALDGGNGPADQYAYRYVSPDLTTPWEVGNAQAAGAKWAEWNAWKP